MELSSPSEDDILELVAKRESFRQARRFEESDRIRNQLREMGVELYDKEREWRCKDGRRGHLFTAGAVQCSLHDEEIKRMIFDREDARVAKDWTRADQIRDDLRNLGVEIDDKTKLWRTHNGRSGTYSGIVNQSISFMSEDEIRTFITERERARAAQDFNRADEVRRHLASAGVEISDSQRVWRSSDGRKGVFVTGGLEIVQCCISDADIQVRVVAREQSRVQKDFATADAYRDELRRFGVELLDHEQKWKTTDGRSGSYGTPLPSTHSQLQAFPEQGQIAQHPQQWQPALSTSNSPQAMACSGGGSTASTSGVGCPAGSVFAGAVPGALLSSASIEALLMGREGAREGRDFATADGIRQDLRLHGVEVWDKQKTWKCIDGRAGNFPIIQPQVVAVGVPQPAGVFAAPSLAGGVIQPVGVFATPPLPPPSSLPPPVGYQPLRGRPMEAPMFPAVGTFMAFAGPVSQQGF